jgi:hypothetical protein
MSRRAGGVMMWVGLGLQTALASTGWVERLDLQPPPVQRQMLPEGLVLYYGNGSEPGKGAPDLPIHVQALPARPGYRITARLVKTEFSEEAGVAVAPSIRLQRSLVEDNRYTTLWVREADAEIYGRDAFWPADLVQVDEAWQGTNKLARLAVWPVQWNARTKVLRVHSRFELELSYQPE